MHEKLNSILLYKQQEVSLLKQKILTEPNGLLAKIVCGQLKNYRPRKSLLQALIRGQYIKIIAEIKRRSPAKGALAPIINPVALALAYANAGAAAISVLTDSSGFGGSGDDLHVVSDALATTEIPLLRKDFLIDPIQLAESLILGADAVLLIAKVLGTNLKPMLDKAKELKIEALVEVHTRAEIDQAIAAGAEIIGVNNRNLHTFEISTKPAFDLIDYLPKSVVKIAESGILQTSLAQSYYAVGYDAVLVGEALVKASDPQQWIKEASYAH